MEKDARSRWFELFAAQGRKFTAYVRRKIQSISAMDAEDIVSEVMLSLLRKPDRSGPVENLTAYVYRSLHNRIVDYQRSRSPSLSLESFMDDDGEMRLLDLLTDSSGCPDEVLVRKEFMGRLSQAISQLEPRQRAVFVATELMGRSFRELAEMWKEPMGTLLSRKCRAVKAIREMLRDLQ